MLTVHNYIYDSFKERGMKSFEMRVSKLIWDSGITNANIICHNSYMERANGSGSYYKCAEIELNGEIIILKQFTHDSELWDNWVEPTSKDKRNLFLSVLDNKISELSVFLFGY